MLSINSHGYCIHWEKDHGKEEKVMINYQAQWTLEGYVKISIHDKLLRVPLTPHHVTFNFFLF